jgi:phosphoribosylformylglycinamidine synthase
VAAGEIETAHDVSDGGLALALAECCFTGPAGPGPGARVRLAEGIRPDALLFGESTGRVIVATADPDALLARARGQGVPAAVVGETGGDRLEIAAEDGRAWIDLPVARLHQTWAEALPRRVEAA